MLPKCNLFVNRISLRVRVKILYLLKKDNKAVLPILSHKLLKAMPVFFIFKQPGLQVD